MANSQVQLQAEKWVCEVWLPEKYGQTFRPTRLRLETGGYFNFDAVSEDNSIVANISTSSAFTAGGRGPAAKIQKLRADMLFLLMMDVPKRFIVLTEKDMYELCLRKKVNGRVPNEIEFLHALLPAAYVNELQKAKKIASEEVSPNRRKSGEK
jgi:hypothetical protein